MELPKLETLPGGQRLERAARAGLKTAQQTGKLAASMVQWGADQVNKATGRDTYHELEQAANINSINGCFTRRMFFKKLNHLLNEEQPSQLFIVSVDARDFSGVNKKGYHLGDIALAVTGWALRELYRDPETGADNALVGSFGGDEFLGVLPIGVEMGNPTLRKSIWYHQEDGHNLATLNFKELLNGVKAMDRFGHNEIERQLETLVDAGVHDLTYWYAAGVADVEPGMSGGALIDQFVAEHPLKQDSHIRHASRE